MLEISPNEQSSENATLRLLLKETNKKKKTQQCKVIQTSSKIPKHLNPPFRWNHAVYVWLWWWNYTVGIVNGPKLIFKFYFFLLYSPFSGNITAFRWILTFWTYQFCIGMHSHIYLKNQDKLLAVLFTFLEIQPILCHVPQVDQNEEKKSVWNENAPCRQLP